MTIHAIKRGAGGGGQAKKEGGVQPRDQANKSCLAPSLRPPSMANFSVFFYGAKIMDKLFLASIDAILYYVEYLFCENNGKY